MSNKIKEQFYTMNESFTSRTDISPSLKLVLVNIINKLQIPKKHLVEGFYTFSISNVAKEMGLPPSTVKDQFTILECRKALKRSGTKVTSHGEVVLYQASTEIIDDIITGKIKFPTKIKKEKPQYHLWKANDSEKVNYNKDNCDEVGITATVEGITATVEGITATVTSTQIEHTNNNIQINSTQIENFQTKDEIIKSELVTNDNSFEILDVKIPSVENFRDFVLTKKKAEDFEKTFTNIFGNSKKKS